MTFILQITDYNECILVLWHFIMTGLEGWYIKCYFYLGLSNNYLIGIKAHL